MPGRHGNTSDYRYLFNGMEGDNEIKGEGNSYDFGARKYNPRIARWSSPDPLEKAYAEWSPYNFVMNNPINLIDPSGMAPETIYKNKETEEEIEVKDGVDKTIEVSNEDFLKAQEFASLGKLNRENQNWNSEKFSDYRSFYRNQVYGSSTKDRIANFGNYLFDGLKDELFDSGLNDPYREIAIVDDYGLLSGGATRTKSVLRGTKYFRDFYKAYPKLQKFIGRGLLEIHHRIPQRYINSGLFPESMRTSLSNLQGLPRDVHRKIITPLWNKWSRKNTNPSQSDVLKFAREVDELTRQFINKVKM